MEPQGQKTFCSFARESHCFCCAALTQEISPQCCMGGPAAVQSRPTCRTLAFENLKHGLRSTVALEICRRDQFTSITHDILNIRLQNHINFVLPFFLLNLAYFTDQYSAKYISKTHIFQQQNKAASFLETFPVHKEKHVNPVAMCKNTRYCIPAWNTLYHMFTSHVTRSSSKDPIAPTFMLYVRCNPTARTTGRVPKKSLPRVASKTP